MRYVGTTTGRLPVDTGQVRLRGPRVSASSARHLVADARGGDVPAHPRLAPARRPAVRFRELGAGYYPSRIDTDRKTRNHVRQLEALGYTVALGQAA